MKYSGKWYYLGNDGKALVYRNAYLGGHWYWFKADGTPAHDETVYAPNGTAYRYNSRGWWVR